MYKIIPHRYIRYAEEHQQNPLRWTILHMRKGELHQQRAEMRCKDFFNDIVAWKQAKHRFTMYGFTNDVRFNREGLYILLTNIQEMEVFLGNLTVLNSVLDEKLQMKITKQDESSVVICFPSKVFSSTYRISLLSLLIRVCNYKVSLPTWESFFEKGSPLVEIENACSEQARELALKHKFNAPVDTWLYAPGKTTGETVLTMKAASYVIHNNGIVNWATALKGIE